MRTPALILIAMASANAQNQLPSAQPYTASPAVQAVIPGASPTAPAGTPVRTYQSTYTYTSTEDSPNPRENALKESFKYALQGLLNQTFQPPVPQAEVKRLTEQSDPARFVQSYRIVSESFAPAYTLSTEITWSEKALLNALQLTMPATATPAKDVMNSDVPPLTSDATPANPATYSGPVQFILLAPTGSDIARLRTAATAAGLTAKMASFSRTQAVFEGPESLVQALTAAGYAVEEDPTAFTPTYRIQ